MQTDSFFCQLLKDLPETLFELLGQPASRAKAYRFDSVELKKSLRIDGLFLPKKRGLPLYFVEVQFRRLAKFYANLFAKVFCYLEENNPGQEWYAVAIFPGRGAEPRQLNPYLELLLSPRVRRIYLDEYPMPSDPPIGLGILQLVTAPQEQTPDLVAKVLHKVEHELTDVEQRPKVVELVEELLMLRYTQKSREELRTMFKLRDLRKTRVWQEAAQEGREEGKAEGREEGQSKERKAVIKNLRSSGFELKRISEYLKIPIDEVRRLAKD